MEALTIEAKLRARNAIVKRFKYSVDLENIAAGTIAFYFSTPYLLTYSLIQYALNTTNHYYLLIHN
jgi:hypothetical protein